MSSKVILTVAYGISASIGKLMLAGLNVQEIYAFKVGLDRREIGHFRRNTNYYSGFENYVASILTQPEIDDLKSCPLKTSPQFSYHALMNLGHEKFKELRKDKRNKSFGTSKLGFWYVLNKANHKENVAPKISKARENELWAHFKSVSYSAEKPVALRYI